MADAQNQRLPQLLNVSEAADRLGCCEANIYALIKSGQLAYIRVGRRKGYRIELVDITKFIEQRKEQKSAAVPNRVRTPQPKLKHIRLP